MRKWGSERHVKQIMEKWSSLSLTSRSLPPSRANDILNVNTAVIWSGLVGSKITSSWLVAAAAVTIGASSLVRVALSHRFLIRTFQAANYARDCCPSRSLQFLGQSMYAPPRYGGFQPWMRPTELAGDGRMVVGRSGEWSGRSRE